MPNSLQEFYKKNIDEPLPPARFEPLPPARFRT